VQWHPPRRTTRRCAIQRTSMEAACVDPTKHAMVSVDVPFPRHTGRRHDRCSSVSSVSRPCPLMHGHLPRRFPAWRCQSQCTLVVPWPTHPTVCTLTAFEDPRLRLTASFTNRSTPCGIIGLFAVQPPVTTAKEYASAGASICTMSLMTQVLRLAGECLIAVGRYQQALEYPCRISGDTGRARSDRRLFCCVCMYSVTNRGFQV
jgi:hypothetical protein